MPPTPEQRQLKAAIDDVQAFIAKNKRENEELRTQVRDLETLTARMTMTPGHRSAGAAQLSPEVRVGLTSFIVNGDHQGVLRPQAAASVGTDPSGGYFVPEEVDREIERLQRNISPVRQIARVHPTRAVSLDVIVDVNNAGWSWAGETEGRPETTSPDVKKVNIPLNEGYALPKATQTLLDAMTHGGIDLVGDWLLPAIADAKSAAEGAAFVSGNGVGRPRGFLDYTLSTAPDATRAFGQLQYKFTGVSGNFAAAPNGADALIDLVHCLRAPYRANARWVMNSLTLSAARKLKDSNGDYLIRRDFTEGGIERLLGYPVTECEDMPDIAANSLSIAFGDFRRGYRIPDGPTSLLRDPYTAKPYVLFYAYGRVGGGVTNFEAIKLLKFGTS